MVQEVILGGRGMMRRRAFLAGLALIGTEACRRGPRPIMVGSASTTEQALFGEIAAQHLEHRLARKVERRLRIGGPLISYQALQNGEISVHAEYAGTIITEILREQPAADASVVLERARNEMRRTARAELFDPLGVSADIVGVIRANDPRAESVSTLSEAARVADGWKIAVSFEFQQRPDGIPGLSQYHLPMVAPLRAVDSNTLFQKLGDGQVSLILTTATDGALVSSSWKSLRDDRGAFTARQACYLVRLEVLNAEPRIRTAISELSGKLSNQKMRVMNSEVDREGRSLADVAAAFLKSAGLN